MLELNCFPACAVLLVGSFFVSLKPRWTNSVLAYFSSRKNWDWSKRLFARSGVPLLNHKKILVMIACEGLGMPPIQPM